MIGRRTLLGGGVAALAAPVLGQALAYRLDPQPVGDGLWLIRGVDAPIERANGGAINIKPKTPTVPAMNEAMAEIPSAAPARPLRAIW